MEIIWVGQVFWAIAHIQRSESVVKPIQYLNEVIEMYYEKEKHRNVSVLSHLRWSKSLQTLFRSWLLVTIAICFASATKTATAATYYLDASASGANNGSSWTDAWETIASMDAGLDALGDDGSGDTVLVKSGSYGAITDDGVWEKVRTDWLEIKADTEQTPIFGDTEIVANAMVNMYLKFDGIKFLTTAKQGSNDNFIRVRYCKYLKFLNCDFVGIGFDHSTYTGKGLYLQSCSEVEIDNCKVYGDGNGTEPLMAFYHGIDSRYSNNVTITDCEIQECGVAITAWGDSWLIARNHIFDGTIDGIDGVSIANSVIEDNHIHDLRQAPGLDDHNDCIQLWSPGGILPGNPDYVYVENITIRRNKLYNSGGQILYWNSFTPEEEGGYEARNILIENNLFYNGGLDSPGAWDVSMLGYVTVSWVNNTCTGGVLFRKDSVITRFQNNIVDLVDVEFSNDAVLLYEDYNIVRTWWVNMPGYVQGVHTAALGDQSLFETLFTDYDNELFTLVKGSTAFNFGNSANAPEKDINGITRGNPPDAGAYEYTGPVILIQKLRTKAGKSKKDEPTRGEVGFIPRDRIIFQGIMDGVEESDLINDPTINIEIISDSNDYLVYHEFINHDPSLIKKGKYRYKRKIQRGAPGAITSLQLDFIKHKFKLMAKGINLVGLSSPMSLKFEVDDYYGEGTADESIINGPRKPVPIQFMTSYGDVVFVDKMKLKNPGIPGSMLQIKGRFAMENPNSMELHNQGLELEWKSQTFTIPKENFEQKRAGQWQCRKAIINDEKFVIDAKFDRNKCAYTIKIKAVSDTGIDALVGSLDFRMAFGSFNEWAEAG